MAPLLSMFSTLVSESTATSNGCFPFATIDWALVTKVHAASKASVVFSLGIAEWPPVPEKRNVNYSRMPHDRSAAYAKHTDRQTWKSVQREYPCNARAH